MIAHVVCVFPPYKGGIGNAAYNFARVLAKQDARVVVFTPKYGKSDFKSDLFLVKWIKPFLKYGNAAFLPQLIFKLRKYDVVHLHYPFFGTAEMVWLAKLMFKKDFKLFIHYHMDVEGSTMFTKIFSWPSKMVFYSLLGKAKLITCASKDYIMNSQIADYYSSHKEKFIEIPFGVDIEKFYFKKNFKKEGNNILFVGALDKAHYFKGIKLLLESLAQISNRNWRLNIVGGGDMLKEYITMAKNLGLKNVNFLGSVNDEDLARRYRSSDFLVLPSVNKNEAFGLVLLEAMSSGTAVLASDLPGVRSVFENGRQGFLFKTGDKQDLRQKIIKMLDDKEMTKQMGIAGRKLVEEKYSWDKIGQSLNRIYKQNN